MKAACIREHGDLDQIRVVDIDDPVPGPGEVLIETAHAALNHLDHFVVRGWPGLNLDMPHVLGADGAGIVKETGPDVSVLAPGDAVTINPGLSCGTCDRCLAGLQNLCKSFGIMGEHRNGTFATKFVVPAVNALRVPAGFLLDVAAAAPLVFLTAWRMVVTRARVKPGDIVLVHGAGGGLATAAIQVAKLHGATVIATTSTPDKMERARLLGASHVINYKEEPGYGARVFKELTGKRGVDVVIDSVGAPTFGDSIRLLRPDGVLVIPGATAGPNVDLNLRQVFWKQLRVVGSTMATQGEFRDAMRFVFSGHIVPVIDRTFPLEEAKEAETYLASGAQFGKVLLAMP